MLARSLHARAALQTRAAAPSSQLAAVRKLSMAAKPSPSPVALGKRPVILPRRAALAGVAVRHLSWTPWSSSSSTPAPAAEPEAAAAAANASANPSIPINTPVPSSDIPADPVEPPLPPADHLTSTAPDNQFHSDPSSLLPQSGANSMTPTLEDLITKSGLPLEEVLNSPEAVHAAVKVSDLSLMGLEHGPLNPAGWLRDALVGLHNITALPWWATIALMTVTVRLILLRFVISNARHNVRLAAVQPQMTALMKRLSDAKTTKDQNAMQVATQNLSQLMKENDVSPFRPLLMPLMQMPFFLAFFYALRRLADAPLPQLKEGGFGWVMDLTVADPYYILPMTSIALQLLVLHFGADGSAQARAQSQLAHMRNGLTVASPFLVYFVSQFPAAVLFYWTTANTFTLIQALALQQNWVKKLFRIPPAPVIAPPPEDSYVNPNPGFKDTWGVVKNFHRDSFAPMLERANLAKQAKEEAAALAKEKEIRSNARAGTGLLTERVQEPRRSAFLEADAAASSSSPSEPVVRLSREEEKRQRIQAAREKRSRQQ
ncbi:Mitochondrial inner membrane protein OXA1L [Vanrija pseudolonga]|uniref:Mitochondrial inner membrane protein OXA1L n=1 Tax=Vanrija pseudolonga TaxID=143232 RepID=A0AAF1BQX0_9TREE|nr:Mitochondrial inner membrane protein OXA1L [Vanrija pseudolonga]